MIEIKIGEFEGYSAAKFAEDESETTYVSLGSENAYDRTGKIAIVSMSDLSLYVIGTGEFYAAIHKEYKEKTNDLPWKAAPLTDVSGFRRIAIGHAVAELLKNPDRFVHFIASVKASGVEEGERQAKERIREALGL